MKCWDHRDVVFVLSFGPFSHTEAAAALSVRSWHGCSSFSGTVVHYDFDVPRDLLVSVRSHFFCFFTAVILIPPTST